MPGYVMHLAAAKRFFEISDISDSSYKSLFLLGSVVPDTRDRADKKESHYWTTEGYKLFVRKPHLDIFLSEYENQLYEPYIFGYYAHLLMDVLYLEDYWRKHFRFTDSYDNDVIFYDEVSRVHILDDGRIYDIKEFFSDKYYYGDYDRINPYMLKKYNITGMDLIVPGKDCDIFDRLPSVGGICVKDNTERLASMRSIIQEEHRIGESNPKLEVLRLDEINNLIEKTARKLSEKLRTVS